MAQDDRRRQRKVPGVNADVRVTNPRGDQTDSHLVRPGRFERKRFQTHWALVLAQDGRLTNDRRRPASRTRWHRCSLGTHARLLKSMRSAARIRPGFTKRRPARSSAGRRTAFIGMVPMILPSITRLPSRAVTRLTSMSTVLSGVYSF